MMSDLHVRAAYFSLGDREPLTRNPVMQSVADNTAFTVQHLSCFDVATTFQWNPGNHFVDGDKRVAKGIRWVMEQLLQ